ncbi:unnamed protein product [Nippostrongylus brasiliensis]|uniref:Transposase n=1 Tax=Nippostrongylus brasiliensis TaxID=27835 RepID=A0A0N4XEB2_NIPBR|nr:unnamed protein product [Nippostrongylus brasiliensis]
MQTDVITARTRVLRAPLSPRNGAVLLLAESELAGGVYSDPEPAASSPAESGNGKNRRKRTTFTQHQAAILEKARD